METSNLTLAYLVAELKQAVEGTFINSIQSLNENTLKIKLHSKEQGTIELIAAANALYRTNYKLKVQEKQSGFAAFLKKRLYNKRILSIEQHGFDRIIEMHFAESDLVFELFAQGNVIFNDKTGKIISCQRNEEWRDRKIRRNEQYIFPAGKKSILESSEEEFKKALQESSQDCVRAVITVFNIAPVAAEEACALAKIEKQKKSKELSAAEIKKLFLELQQLYAVEIKNLQPVVFGNEKEQQLLPFRFSSVAAEQKRYNSLSEALDEHLSVGFAKAEETKANAETDKKKARLQYSLAEQLKARERLEKDVVESKKKAELIYSHFTELKELVEAINRAIGKKTSKKELMYKIKNAALEGNKTAGLLVEFDEKGKKIFVELENN